MILRQAKKFDSRLRIYRNKKKYGLSITLNRGVKRAKGRYITFMDPHDKSTLYKIKRQLNFLTNNPKVAAIGTQCTVMNAQGKKIEKSQYPADVRGIKQGLINGLSVKFETLLIDRTRIPKDLLKFRTNAYPFVYTEVLLKLMQYSQIANLDQTLHYHRQEVPKAYAQLDKLEKWATQLKIWAQTVSNEETRPAFRDFIPSINLPLKLSK